MVSNTETIRGGLGGRPRAARASRQMLCRDIIQPRIEEIFSFSRPRSCGWLRRHAGLRRGDHRRRDPASRHAELAEEVLGIPVRLGMPKGVGGLADVVKRPPIPPASVWCNTPLACRACPAAPPIRQPAAAASFSRLRRVFSSAF